MRLLVQRVKEASVRVDGAIVGAMRQGLLVFVGFGQQDGSDLPEHKVWKGMIDKVLHARIFPGKELGKEEKFDLDVLDFGGSVLVVSQFTLYADCSNGRRPGFQEAAPPDIAAPLFDRFVQDIDARLEHRVSSGIFGAKMDVSLINWGPVTLMLDSDELFPSAKLA